MNKYGYFAYEDYPLNATFSRIVPNFSRQYQDYRIYSRVTNLPIGLKDWATFEQNEFDFTQPIWCDNSSYIMPCVSTDLSDENGFFSSPMTIDITPTEAYSGSGISLKLFNDYYAGGITITDLDGTRTVGIVKNEEEFYPFVFNGMQSMTIKITKVEPYHFLKFAGFQLGRVRIFNDKDLIGEPTIINHFSLTGDDLEYDTLDFTIRDNKSELNIITGERIIYSETNQAFYIDTAVHNSDGTIDISCYDNVAMLEDNFIGVRATTGTASSWIETALQGGKDLAVNVGNMFTTSQTFSGVIGTDSYREAARLMLLGNAMRVKREDGVFEVFCPQQITDAEVEFNNHNVVSVPEIELMPKYRVLRFLKHYYTRDVSQGKVEGFNGHVDIGNSRVEFGAPYNSIDWYYVSGTDSNGDDILTPVSSTYFYVIRSGELSCDVHNEYTQRIVAMGYPFNESSYPIQTVQNVAVTYKENRINITNCTVLLNLSTYTEFLNFLKYIYKFDVKMSFRSITDALCGDYVALDIDGVQYNGWVTQKKSNMNGVYDYEVIAYVA